jgi:valyl-tRNA synthetase
VSLLIEIVRTVRNMRAELRIEPAKLVSEMVILAGADERRLLEEHMALLAKMTRCERWVFIPDEQAVADLKCATGLAGVVRLYLPLTQFGDLLDKEIARLRKELNALESERLRVDSQLANDAFVARAPVAVVQKLRDRSVEIVRQLEVVQQTLARWEGA